MQWLDAIYRYFMNFIFSDLNMGDGAKVQENLLSISWHDSAWIPVLNQERNQDQRLSYFELKLKSLLRGPDPYQATKIRGSTKIDLEKYFKTFEAGVYKVPPWEG